MKSLNQIIAELEDFATAHWQIHTFGHGDVWEISPQSSGIVYPVLWMVPQAASPTLNVVTDEFTVLCMDLVDSGERNETEVLSDTRQIILDVCAYYRQTHTNDYIIEFGSSIQPFTERDPERVSGHSLTIRIKQPHDYNLCAVPANAVPVPPIPSCADATVQNAASNPTYQASVASGGSLVLPQLKVLDSDGVTPILANYIPNTSGFAVTCTPPTCADATVTVNTAPFGTAPSGGGLNVPVINGGSNPVGSKQGIDWVIDNNATFINATQVTDQEAEVDANIFVTLDGTQAGTWNAGIQTWEVTSAASGSVSVTVSDATPSTGETITITATPTGLTPTSYLFFAYQGTTITFIAEQAGNVVNWSVTLLGVFDIYALATDGSIEVYSTVSAISTGDHDASAFIIAAGITDITEKSAVTALTLALKAASLYTKFIAVYPLLGGTANSHKYNLIDPQDTDVAHRLTFSGGWTHTSNGARGNASNTFANTHIIPNALLTSGSNSVGVYTRSNVSENTYDFGCSTDASALYNPFGVISWYNSGNAAYYMSGNYNLSAAVSSASGLTHGFGNSGTWRLYRNGAQIGSTASSAIALPNFALYLGGNNGGGTLSLVSSREYAFAFVANQQMTPTDAVNLYAIIQAYQTTLNRQV